MSRIPRPAAHTACGCQEERTIHHKHFAILASCVVALVLPSSGAAKNLSTHEWRQDLQYMARQLEQWHANLYHTVDREEFEAAVAALDRDIPNLAPHQIIVGLSRIVASVGDAHTYLFPPFDGPFAFGKYPVQYEWFSDGLFVTVADRSLTRILGAQVLRMGKVAVDSALSLAGEIGYRENASTTRITAPRVLVIPEVLHALGIIDDAGPVRLLVKPRGEAPVEVFLDSRPAAAAFSWVDARESATGPTPLYQRRPADPYWLEYLPEDRALYVQMNRCRDMEGEPIAEFADRIDRTLVETGAEKLILDVRSNIGGSWQATLPLVHTVIGNDRINRKGHFFVITGRYTLSATVVMIGQLRWHTHLTLVGEPTGARPNLYGENPFALELPNSGLEVKWASEYFQPAGAFERATWIAPEVAAELSSRDYLLNRDPALRAALDYTGPRDLETDLKSRWSSGGLRAAESEYRAFRGDPRNKYVDTFRAVRRFGNSLLDAGDTEDALRVFGWNLDAYPERARTYIRLGHAQAVLNRRDQAVALFEEARERLAGDETLYGSLRYALLQYVDEWLDKLR
ncbi:MAG: S41 family peptidase [Candidatus Krumholzibacteria bacterium]|nr:S41 family peptidase [Candidatus Krumholzibacteria bacterium]